MAHPSTRKSENLRLDTFLDDVYEREVAESPIAQAQLGRRTDRYGEWDDFSDAFEEECIERTADDLGMLESGFTYDLLGENQQLSYNTFKFNLRYSNFVRNFLT